MVATVIWGEPPQGYTHLTTRVEVQGPRGTKIVKALIDGSTNVNIISQMLVKKLDLEPIQIDYRTVLGLAGHPITTFGIHKIKMTTRDSKDSAQTTSKVITAAII